MGSTYPNHLRLAIAKAAEEIPFELMMAIAPDAARKLLAPYRNLDISEVEVLAALVTAVIVRRELPPIADGPPRQETVLSLDHGVEAPAVLEAAKRFEEERKKEHQRPGAAPGTTAPACAVGNSLSASR